MADSSDLHRRNSRHAPDSHLYMDEAAIERSLIRISHEILERNAPAENLAIIGILTRGDILAHKIYGYIHDIEGIDVPIGALDINLYRDDFATYLSPDIYSTQIDFSIDGKDVVLIDDILYTGRTIRCALDALVDIGRPHTIQLAVLIDRGHRQLPISPDYVGRNIPTGENENIRLLLQEVDHVPSSVEILPLGERERAHAAPLPRPGKKRDGSPKPESSFAANT